eukprot:XP_025001432.1 elongation factor 1-gamma [Gallus gallus]
MRSARGNARRRALRPRRRFTASAALYDRRAFRLREGVAALYDSRAFRLRVTFRQRPSVPPSLSPALLKMAVSGTLYTYPDNWRSFKAQIAAQYSGAQLRLRCSSDPIHPICPHITPYTP